MMPTELEKRAAINAIRAADHGIEAVRGSIAVVGSLLKEHGWDSLQQAVAAREVVKAAQSAIDLLHQRVYDEALDRGETIPTDGTISPMSGGGSKGGGG